MHATEPPGRPPTRAGQLLRIVHRDGPMSRAQLARRMGVNRSTILSLTTELAAAGLVREDPPITVTGAGRPSLVVRPAADRAHVLAFDVSADGVSAARIGLGASVQHRRQAPRAWSGDDLGDVIATVAAFARDLQATAEAGSFFAGVSVSICGMVRPRDGIIRYSPQLGFVDQPFGERLGKALDLGRQIAVHNECHMGALGEYARGCAVAVPTVVYLHGDRGVGGGVLTDGMLLGGDDGYGAELGHMVVNPHDGRPCACGSQGCLEAEIGESAILAAAGRPANPGGRDAVRAVVADAAAGDPQARAAVAMVGDWLGIAVSNLINLFNPGMVVFGGTLREVYAAATDHVEHRMARHVLPVSRGRTRLSGSALADDATLLGAAEIGFADLLTDPLDTVSRYG